MMCVECVVSLSRMSAIFLLCFCHSIVRLCVNFVYPMLLCNAVMFEWRQTPFNLVLFCSVRLLIRFGLLSIFLSLLFVLYTYEGSGFFVNLLSFQKHVISAQIFVLRISNKIRFHIFHVSSQAQHAFNVYVRMYICDAHSLRFFACAAKTVSGTLCRTTPFSKLLLSFVYAHGKQNRQTTKSQNERNAKID